MNTFLFDGNCGFCRDLAAKLEKGNLDPNTKFISFRDKTDLELQSIHSDLTQTLCSGNVQLIHKGKRYPGFFAIRKLAHQLEGYRWIAFLLYLPLVPVLGISLVYLAKHFRAERP